MINDDVLIGYARRNPVEGLDWVDRAKELFEKIRFIRDKDFLGIGLNDLDLIESYKVEPGMRIILPGDINEASIVGQVLRRKDDAIELEIEALGCGTDEKRDPGRVLRYGTKVYPSLKAYDWVLRVTSKARANAGSLYYFFSKSMRDNRINHSEDPEVMKKMILGSLCSNLFGDTRIRAQYMHFLRRIQKEIESLGVPEGILRDVYICGEKVEPIREVLKNEGLEKISEG